MNHLIGDDESLHSSDEDLVSNHVREPASHFHLHRRMDQTDLNPVEGESSDSDTENVTVTEASSPIVQMEKNQKRVESYSTTV